MVGYFSASYIVSRPARRQALILLLIIVPFWTDCLVRTFAWINLLSDGGPVVSMLRAIGVVDGVTQWVPGQGAVLAGLIYAFLTATVDNVAAQWLRTTQRSGRCRRIRDDHRSAADR